MTSQFKKIGSELKGWDIAPPYIQSIEIESIKLHGVGLMAKHPQWGDVIGAAGSLGAPPWTAPGSNWWSVPALLRV